MRFSTALLLLGFLFSSISVKSQNLNRDLVGFETKTYPSGTPGDFAFAHREVNRMAARWNRGAKLYKVGFRMAPPLPDPDGTLGGHGMLEAVFYYFAPGTNQNSWNGLQVTAKLSYGDMPYTVRSVEFDSNVPYPPAAPSNLVDPTEALRRLNLNPEGFLKGGVHLKVAGGHFSFRDNFTLQHGPFQNFIDHTLPAGKWVWFTEFHPGNGNNTFVYFDAVTGEGKLVPQL